MMKRPRTAARREQTYAKSAAASEPASGRGDKERPMTAKNPDIIDASAMPPHTGAATPSKHLAATQT
jgi:hypothetical protein